MAINHRSWNDCLLKLLRAAFIREWSPLQDSTFLFGAKELIFDKDVFIKVFFSVSVRPPPTTLPPTTPKPTGNLCFSVNLRTP